MLSNSELSQTIPKMNLKKKGARFATGSDNNLIKLENLID